MSAPASPRIHSTALISPEAELPTDISIAGFCIIEGKGQLGPGCVLHPRVHLIGPFVLGRDNQIFSNAVIGEQPQHLNYQEGPAGVTIGDGNVFRENVTVHRGMKVWTKIGSGNVLMVGAHVGHDCQVGDGCILDNKSMVGGHAVIGDRAHLGENCAIHQWCKIGRLAVVETNAIATMDVPPFVIEGDVNRIAGVNDKGLLAAGFSETQMEAIHQAYQIYFHQKLLRPEALAKIERELFTVDVVREFVEFIRGSERGIGQAL